MDTKKLFIVFEGLDGMGNTTHANLLCSYLNNNKEFTCIKNNPTEGPIGHLIKEILQKRICICSDFTITNSILNNLFLADRYYHNFNEVDGINNILKYKHVISSRYYYSAMAYQAESIIEAKKIYDLHTTLIQPDIVFYLQGSPELSIMRLRHRQCKELTESYENLRKRYLMYESIFIEYRDMFFMNKTIVRIIDARQSVSDIQHKEILPAIDVLLKTNQDPNIEESCEEYPQEEE